MADIQLRRARMEDASQIQAIFSYYVFNSIATYRYEPPPIESFEQKIKSTDKFPFLVAVKGDTVLGYAYVSEYRPLPGYRYTVEDTIFIHHEYNRQGLGRLLLGALVDECQRLGYLRMIAVFGSGREDLPGTFKLHESFGFREVGRLTAVGEKFGRWLDTPIFQLDLTSTTTT